MSATGLVWEEDCLAHFTGVGHPESPQRLEAIRAGLERFRPSLLLVSAGFDAMAGDPLADLRLNASDVTALTELALGDADRYSQGRLVSLLEGGYDLNNLAEAAVAHVGALLAG